MKQQFTLSVEEYNGLWTVTSRSAVERGTLLVAKHSLADVLAAVPQAIADLEAAATNRADAE